MIKIVKILVILSLEVTLNFERQKLTHDQHIESSYFDHSKSIFLLITSYFPAHLYVIILLVKILKSTITHILK